MNEIRNKMKGYATDRIWRTLCVSMAGLFLMVATAVAQNAPAPVLGSTTLGAGTPTGPSPDTKANLYSLDVYYFNADGSLGKSSVPVPGIPVTAGLPNPTAAQILAARTAKAAAIVAAINAATLNGVTAVVDPKDPTLYTVGGVRQSVGKYKFPTPGTDGTYLGPAITRTPGNRVTGELGNTQFNFKAGGGGSSSSGSMYRGSLDGPGTSSGTFASGLDASGFQSVIGFGFINESTSTPLDYTVSINLSSGMTDADVLGLLASLFNTAYSSSGYTATYDLLTNSLSIEQLLSSEDVLWSSDSDTSLDLTTNMISAVPEPGTVSLLVFGPFGLFAFRRREKWA